MSIKMVKFTYSGAGNKFYTIEELGSHRVVTLGRFGHQCGHFNRTFQRHTTTVPLAILLSNKLRIGYKTVSQLSA